MTEPPVLETVGMDEVLVQVVLVALLAGLVTSVMVPLVTRLATALKAIDHPGGRRSHQGAVPRLGGVAIVAGIVLGVGSLAWLEWPEWGEPMVLRDLGTVLLGTLMVFLLGIADDLVGVSAVKKLLVQVAAAWIVVEGGWRFEVVGLPAGAELHLGPLSGFLTVLWIVGVTNAVNLFDGLDGLVSGVVAIIAASLLVFAFLQGRPYAVMLLAGIAGACLGFLPHNSDPARIFMGDAGSQPLGFLLAALSVYCSLKSSTTVAILVPLLALGVPVIDTLLVMQVRFLERPKGKLFNRVLRIFDADRNHLHHLLESLVVARRNAVRWIYVMVAFSAVMALTVAVTKRGGLGWVLVAVELVAIVLVRLGLARRVRRLAHRKREHLKATSGPFNVSP